MLLACEERLLPSWRALASPDPERLAEERRLFYVAATRAKDRLVITHAATRGGRPTGGPSRFLAEAGLLDPRGPRRLTTPTPKGAPMRNPDPATPTAAGAAAARAHPRAGGRAAPAAVRARRDRLSRHDQGHPTTASRTPARRSPPT